MAPTITRGRGSSEPPPLQAQAPATTPRVVPHRKRHFLVLHGIAPPRHSNHLAFKVDGAEERSGTRVPHLHRRVEGWQGLRVGGVERGRGEGWRETLQEP